MAFLLKSFPTYYHTLKIHTVALNGGVVGFVIKHTPKASLIQRIPYQNVPTHLRLYKQRYRCKDCDHTFSATTKIVDENCYLSNALKFAILNDLKEKCSMTDIANRYFVSTKTVERILRSYTYVVNPYTYQLPECLLVDEFKGTNDCHSKFCFIFSDGETLKICEEESFYTKKIGKRKNQRNENVEENLLKTFPQSPTHCNRWL